MLWNTHGHWNTAIGNNAFYHHVSGQKNTALGHWSGYRNTSGSFNTNIGAHSNENNTKGKYNTIVGFAAGYGVMYHSKSGNVFIGYKAGYNDTTDNKLYIENSDTINPLIYGDFEFDTLRINGTLDINKAYRFPITEGSDLQILKTNGSGSLSWTNDSIGATQINDLNDAKSDINSVFLGDGAGATDNGSNANVAVGIDALNSNTSGSSNIACGTNSLYHNVEGSYNTANGVASLKFNTEGDGNTAIGSGSMQKNTTGNGNVAIGRNANFHNQKGSYNTIIGNGAGMSTYYHSKSGNVFIGNSAGSQDTTDNKLYIENSNILTPLIYGDFENDLVSVFGNLGVGTKSFGGGSRTLALINGVFPTSSIVNGVLLYAQDMTPPFWQSELRVRDEQGNITTLSPHNFCMIQKSEPMAWSFYCENTSAGQKINVDMLRVVRLVEEVTGEKLAYVKSIDDNSEDVYTELNTEGIIKQQQKDIKELQEFTNRQQLLFEQQQFIIEGLKNRIDELEAK